MYKIVFEEKNNVQFIGKNSFLFSLMILREKVVKCYSYLNVSSMLFGEEN